METSAFPVAQVGARRNEDIALDLMKFVASLSEAGKLPGGVGFQQTNAAKGQEIVDKLLDLYTRCLQTVEGKRK
jgi:hypothetical protein